MKKMQNLQVGVLALQGDFQRHQYQLDLVGVGSTLVKLVSDLEGINGLIIPGGESTTMNYMINRFKMRESLLKFGRSKPVWGTCAGMIMLAKNIEDNQSGVEPFGLLDIDVVRVGYGRQVFSFDTSLTAKLGDREVVMNASFIRAPRITRAGDSVTRLVEYNSHPVLVSQNNILASSFHTELDDDTTLLKYFLDEFVA